MSHRVTRPRKRARRPHRLTLPLTVAAFLVPWAASFALGPTDPPVLVSPPAPVVAAVPTVPEVLGLLADRPEAVAPTTPVPTATPTPGDGPPTLTPVAATPSTPSVQIIGSPPDPLPHGAPPAEEVADHVATGHAALARIAYDWQTQLSAWTVVFHPPRDDGRRGVTRPDERRVDVYVHTDDVWTIARITAHEIGHAVDFEYLDTGARRAWKAQRGMAADAPWWPEPGLADFDTGTGDFAECFATWQVGSSSRSPYGPCSEEDLAQVRALAGG